MAHGSVSRPSAWAGVDVWFALVLRRICHYTHMRADNSSTDQPGDSDPLDLAQVDVAVEVFRMLADATRVRLLVALAAGEHSVGDLAGAVGKRPGSVSQHLAKLRMAHLVQTRRNGTHVLYRLANEHVAQLVNDALRHSEHVGVGVPAHHRNDPQPVDR